MRRYVYMYESVCEYKCLHSNLIIFWSSISFINLLAPLDKIGLVGPRDTWPLLCDNCFIVVEYPFVEKHLHDFDNKLFTQWVCRPRCVGVE